MAVTWTTTLPCHPVALLSPSGMQPFAVEPVGHNTFAEVGVVKVTTGAVPIVTEHGLVAKAVAFPAGSATAAVTSF